MRRLWLRQVQAASAAVAQMGAKLAAAERWGREREAAAAAERVRRQALERDLAVAMQRARELEARRAHPPHRLLSCFVAAGALCQGFQSQSQRMRAERAIAQPGSCAVAHAGARRACRGVSAARATRCT